MNIKLHYNFAKKTLFPINRSITGNGIKKTLKLIQEKIPEINIKYIKSGTKVFDWKVPDEWNVSEAIVVDKYNNKIIDFKKNNLHLTGYSIPVNKTVSKKELLKKIYFLKKQKNAIPYITSYYKKTWGFCVTFNQFNLINKKYDDRDKFTIIINSNFKSNGSLCYGEFLLKGKSKKEILISTYVCHPSMANNELSGPIVQMSLIDYFKKKKTQLFYKIYIYT